MLACGFVAGKASGSHVTFRRPAAADRPVQRVTVPKQRPVNIHYIDEVLALIGDRPPG